MLVHTRRTAALAVSACLSVGLLAGPLAPTAAGADATASTRATDAVLPADLPVRLGTRWLRGRASDGLLYSTFDGTDFLDVGLTIDAILAFAAVDARAASDEFTTAVLADEVVAEYGEFGPGAVAKLIVAAQLSDIDPAGLGGDLVAKLESQVTPDGGSAGRVRSTADESVQDFSNTFSQAYAVAALRAAGSPRADDATSYLLAQQCATTGFRGTLAERGALDPRCTDPAQATTDATALVVRLLLPAAGEPAVLEALTTSASWLADQQSADGAFGGGPSTEGDNANSTGLAGWALGELAAADVLPEQLDARAAEAAASAALWLRTLQAADPAACRTRMTPEAGSIATDGAELAAARAPEAGEPTVSEDVLSRFTRASAQALPALAYGAQAAATPRLTQPSRFVRAGEPAVLRFSGVQPGQAACVAGRLVTGDGTDLERTVATPTRTVTRTVEASVVGPRGAVVSRTVVRALAAADLGVAAASSQVRRGDDVRVVVTGLAAGEPVVLRLAGEVVASGRASAQGRFGRLVTAAAPRGRAALVAVGFFDDRRGRTVLRVR